MSSSKHFKLKKGIIQKLFWVISIIFILSLLLVFLFRIIVNSKKYDGSLKIYEYTIKNNEMTKNDDVYVFRGEETNNYIKYGNLMFRIVKIYKDGSMDIVTNESVNSLKYDNKEYSFSNSSIREYLNTFFLDNISQEYLNKSPYCDDYLEDISSYKCGKINFSSYVRLLTVDEYLNSYLDGKSYLSNDKMWLSSNASNFVWVGNNGSVSKGAISEIFYVYPVITLNNRVKYISGNGTEDDPFVIKNKAHDIGSYVKIEDDMYRVIQHDGNKVKLMLVDNDFLLRRNYNDKLLDYLNLDYYEKISYKNVLEKYKIYTGMYDGKSDSINKKNRTVYIGIPTVNDLKFDNSITDYYLINKSSDDKILYYNGVMKETDFLAMKLRPVIVIKDSKIKSGSGTKDSPYVVEG